MLESGAFESVGYSYKPSADDAGYDATFEVAEVTTLYPYRFEALPATTEALRAALRKQEPLLGDRIPATPQVLNRYNAAIRQFFDGKVEAKGELSSRLRDPGDRIPPAGRARPHRRGEFHRQPGDADGPSAPEAFEAAVGHSL